MPQSLMIDMKYGCFLCRAALHPGARAAPTQALQGAFPALAVMVEMKMRFEIVAS
jgi:hypothetical protein